MTTITPDNGLAQVQIYAFDNSLVVTTRFQLLQWKHALKIEMATNTTGSRGSVTAHLRKLLKTPKRYRREWILAHVEESMKDIDAQFASGEFNWEKTA